MMIDHIRELVLGPLDRPKDYMSLIAYLCRRPIVLCRHWAHGESFIGRFDRADEDGYFHFLSDDGARHTQIVRGPDADLTVLPGGFQVRMSQKWVIRYFFWSPEWN
jgi:hypothetical protein